MDGFQTFFNETRTRFFNFLIRLTGDADRAADAFQESYTRYWQRYGQQPYNTGLLFTIGRNIAIDGHRRQKRHRPLDVQIDAQIYDQIADQSRNYQPDQEAAVIIKEEYRNVLAAMETLEPIERELLSLAADGGFRYEQIGQITHISTVNVKVKIHRARQKLRRYLEER